MDNQRERMETKEMEKLKKEKGGGGVRASVRTCAESRWSTLASERNVEENVGTGVCLEGLVITENDDDFIQTSLLSCIIIIYQHENHKHHLLFLPLHPHPLH